MLILVYEYLTGGGSWSETSEDVLRHPLLTEGKCMRQAIVDDLARVPGVELVQLSDARWTPSESTAGQLVPIRSAAEELEQLTHWSGRADGTLLIAPEYDRCLLSRCELVQQSGGRLLSPDPAFVALTTDKHATAQHLSEAGIATPQAELVTSLSPATFQSLPWTPSEPLVLKPTDGVGSLDTYLLNSADDLATLLPHLNRANHEKWRVERYHAGHPVSVAALCGPRGAVLLPPCTQQFSNDGRFTYLGGRYPLQPSLTHRACQLARQTLAAMPSTTGYVGLDLVLSDALDSESDVVLDVNPRLTTSYIGLRHAASSNLAAAMLAIGRGQSHPLFFHAQDVHFNCQGPVDG